MADGTPEGDKSDDSVDEYLFICPACGQEISVNDEMKAAILSNGCPVCASSVGEDCFDG